MQKNEAEDYPASCLSYSPPPITIGRKLIEKLMYYLIIVNRTRTSQKS